MKICPIILIAVLVGGGCSSKETKSDAAHPGEKAGGNDDQVVLKINGTSFANWDVKSFIKIRFSDTSASQGNHRLLSRLFDQFVEHQLILFKAEHDRITVLPEDAAAYLEKMNLGEEGASLNPTQLEPNIKVQKYLYLNVYKDVSVSDAEVRDYYQSHREDFQRAEQVVLHQILVQTQDRAVRIREELLNAPQKFTEIARRESLAPDAENDGQMGSFEKGQLPQEMENVVFSLKIDEISPVVQSPYGFHIFKVTRKMKKRLLPLAGEKETIHNKLLAEKLASAYQEYLERLKKDLRIQVFYDKLYFPYSQSE